MVRLDLIAGVEELPDVLSHGAEVIVENPASVLIYYMSP